MMTTSRQDMIRVAAGKWVPVGLVMALQAAVGAADLYVAPDGNDQWPGTASQPKATLAGVRDAVRELKRAVSPTESITVHVSPGTYQVSDVVDFSEVDSGTETGPISYIAEAGAEVRFSAGRGVKGWRPVRDASIIERLPQAARGNVMVADLRGQGITDYGKLSVRGFGAGNPVAEAELFYDDRPMTLARWPNEGFRGVRSKKDEQTVQVDTDRVSRWVDESDPWIFAYWHHDWAEIFEPIKGLDAPNQVILRSKEIHPKYGITPDRARWYAFNLLAELDQAGEYYLDRENGRLYFWPPQPNGQATLSVANGFIRAEDLSHVTFQGITFEACRGVAISLRGGEHCRIVGCTIRNTGQQAVQVTGGKHHEVHGCDVYQTGAGGIFMSGGDRSTLTPAGHNAENNHLHHYARRVRTYKPAIGISGVGNRIAHNLIHDGPHMALSAGGNDHVIEYNEIHNVVEESGDAGAYYVGRDWTQRGNILRHNYWHQIVGGTGYGGMTIYLDDQQSGHFIYGNLFERCSRAVFIGGGDDNVVTNNVFFDCWKAAHIDNRGMGWQKKATDDPNGTLRTRLRAMPYQNELWSRRYPTLVHVLEDDPNIPKRNVFARNISAGGSWDDITPSIRQYQTVADNLAFDSDEDWVRLVKGPDGRPRQLVFEDPEAVSRMGFVPLQLSKMGLYQDARRASWPVKRQVRPVKLP